MRPRMLLARGEVRHCSTAAALHMAKTTAAKKSAGFEDSCMLHLPPKRTPCSPPLPCLTCTLRRMERGLLEESLIYASCQCERDIRDTY